MTLEHRVAANEQTINQIMALQETTLELMREVKLIQVNQQRQINQHQERMDRFEEQMQQFQQQMLQFQEHMKSMDRFNRQTRRLWIKIAQKVDWLDEDDWPEDEV